MDMVAHLTGTDALSTGAQHLRQSVCLCMFRKDILGDIVSIVSKLFLIALWLNVQMRNVKSHSVVPALRAPCLFDGSRTAVQTTGCICAFLYTTLLRHKEYNRSDPESEPSLSLGSR